MHSTYPTIKKETEATRRARGEAPAVPRTALDLTLTKEEAEGLAAFLDTDMEADDETVRLLIGDGHSGYGLYAAHPEYPNEGAILVKSLPESAGVGDALATTPATIEQLQFRAINRLRSLLLAGGAVPAPGEVRACVADAINLLQAAIFDARALVARAHSISREQIAEWRALQGAGMASAVGEYTPAEFWTLLDAYEALLRPRGVPAAPGTWEHQCPSRPASAPKTVLPTADDCPKCGAAHGVQALRSCPATRPECPHGCTRHDCDSLVAETAAAFGVPPSDGGQSNG